MRSRKAAAFAEAFGLFAEHFRSMPLFEKAFRFGAELALSDGFGTDPLFPGVETWLWSDEAADLRLEHFGTAGQKILADVFAAGVRAGYAMRLKAEPPSADGSGNGAPSDEAKKPDFWQRLETRRQQYRRYGRIRRPAD